ncbi:LexA family protein [Brassicibacter mesophilus]|uniref:LexA family protein n=1 Tax=Brassicibacter mesophilus TaxID=745119 RepID=UPI003D1C517B
MLTRKQKDVLRAIDVYINANGISPTVRNLCDLLGLKSSSTVHGYLNRLEKDGCITKKDTIPRSIRITERGNFILKELW